jgi:hypothetical protein
MKESKIMDRITSENSLALIKILSNLLLEDLKSLLSNKLNSSSFSSLIFIYFII